MRAQYEIRPARPEDLEGILEIERASFGREAYDRKLFAYYINRCPGLFLVAVRRRVHESNIASSGELCGYLIACLRGRPQGSAELVSVAIEPAARGRGAASALLESALRRLARRGAGRLNLVVRTTNLPALAFYEKYGFKRIRLVRGYYEDGADGIAMARPLRLPAAKS